MLGEILVKNNFIAEEILYVALASQTEISYFPIERYRVSKEVIKLLPKELSVKLTAVAVEKIGNMLTIAMVNPFSQEAILAIESATHYKVVPVISCKSQIEKLLG